MATIISCRGSRDICGMKKRMTFIKKEVHCLHDTYFGRTKKIKPNKKWDHWYLVHQIEFSMRKKKKGLLLDMRVILHRE